MLVASYRVHVLVQVGNRLCFLVARAVVNRGCLELMLGRDKLEGHRRALVCLNLDGGGIVNSVWPNEGDKVIGCGLGRGSGSVCGKGADDALGPTSLARSSRVALELLGITVIAGVACPLSLVSAPPIVTVSILRTRVKLVRVCVVEQDMASAKIASGESLGTMATYKRPLLGV